MRTQPLPSPIRASALGIAARLTGILTGLATIIAYDFLRNPRRVGLIITLWSRLHRAARRFERLAARLAAGKPEPKPRAHRPRPKPAAPSPRSMRNAPLPRGHGWIVAELKHRAALYRLYLETLLAEPDTAALLAASPAAARILRPFCRMLGLPPIPESPPEPVSQPSQPAPRRTPPSASHPAPRPARRRPPRPAKKTA